MATIPNKIEKFSDLEKDAFTTIAQANWQKAAAILDYVNKSFPLGMLLFMYNSQDELPATPDPKYWHYCDGSAVNNVNSVFHGITPPDCRNKFFKHPGSGDTYPAIGGSDTINLAHDHSGLTQVASDYDAIRLNDGDETFGAIGPHTHGIASALGSVSIIPAYRTVQVYMRIV